MPRPMPPNDVQIRTVGQSGAGAMSVAYMFAADCIGRFAGSPLWQKPAKTLLDFGACWGRIARAFIPPFTPDRITGVDPNPQFLRFYREALPESRAIVSSEWPPLKLRDESFDFIVGYSVFSHLSEQLCRAWIEDLARVLRPGGMIAVTTRPRWFFDYAANLTGSDPYHQKLARVFADCGNAKAAYDRGEFVHFGLDYGESFIPETYARNAYNDHLHFVGFDDKDGREQPTIFFVKPPVL
jgi:SAM-dependent methyltransferase